MTKQFRANRVIDASPANGPRFLLTDHHRSLEKAYQVDASTSHYGAE